MLKLWENVSPVDKEMIYNKEAEYSTKNGEASIDQQGLQTMKDLNVFSFKSSLYFIISLRKTQ